MNPSPYTLLPPVYCNLIHTKIPAFTSNFHKTNNHNNNYNNNPKTPLYPSIPVPPPPNYIVSHNNNNPSLFRLPTPTYIHHHNQFTQQTPYGAASLVQQRGTKFDDDAFGFDGSDGSDTEGDEGITVVENDSGLSDDLIRNLEENQPSEWMIMKDLLGINIFTYILAGLIVLILSLNLVLGPGWLGQQMGLPGTGTFTEISDSLPDVVDLSAPENLL